MPALPKNKLELVPERIDTAVLLPVSTCNNSVEVVMFPIPTFPVELKILMRWLFAVLKTRSCASVVPKKFTLGFVAVFPNVLHPADVPVETAPIVKLGAVPESVKPLPAV